MKDASYLTPFSEPFRAVLSGGVTYLITGEGVVYQLSEIGPIHFGHFEPWAEDADNPSTRVIFVEDTDVKDCAVLLIDENLSIVQTSFVPTSPQAPNEFDALILTDQMRNGIITIVQESSFGDPSNTDDD